MVAFGAKQTLFGSWREMARSRMTQSGHGTRELNHSARANQFGALRISRRLL